MRINNGWTRDQLLIAFNLYCQLPFGKLHKSNPDIIKYAKILGRTPSALGMKLCNIASLDPAITSTGRNGLKGASNADKAMWAEMQKDWKSFVIEMQNAIATFKTPEIALAVGELSEDENLIDYTGVNKTSLIKIRMGQSFFRHSVLSAYDYQCCVTGITDTRLLVASHIVPWRTDEANRLNPKNGLCLSMLHDKAFDIGILTILDDLTIKVSKKYFNQSNSFFNSAILAYDGKAIQKPSKFEPDRNFLDYHRTKIFEKKGSE
jgi:putative restriction endonuclease